MAANKQSKLLVYLIMALGLILGFLWVGSSDPGAVVPPLSPSHGTSSLQSLRGARIDAGLGADPALTSLRVFGSLPVVPEEGQTGNPFQ